MISGTFTQGEAEDLAKLINYGALPVQLKKISVENVSPSLGQDQLNAGIIAGILGLGLVALYMLFYYRSLGLVVIAGLAAQWRGALLADYVGTPGIFNVQIVLTLAGCHRHHRVRRYHGRLVHRVLRTI